MANNFQAEATNTGGEIFVTRQIDASSVHYPIGLIAHGSSGSETVTSTGAPFPVQIFGNGLSSSNPVFTANNSATPLFIRGVGSSSVPVTGTITVGNDSSDPVGVTNDSSNPIFVRGVGSSAVPITTDTTVTVSNDSSDPVGVTNNSGNALFVRGIGSTNVVVSGTVTSELSSAGAGYDTSNSAQRVNVVAGSAGGTEYTEGDTDATITGTALLFETDSTTNAVGVPSTGTPFPVTVVSGGTSGPSAADTSGFSAGDSGSPIMGIRNASSVAADEYGILRIDVDRFLQVGNDTAHPVTVRGVGSSSVPVVNSSATPVFVRGVGSSAVPVTGTVTSQMSSAGAGYDTGNSALRVNVIAGADGNDTTVTISNTPSVLLDVSTAITGMQTFTGTISSLATTITSSAAIFYGFHAGNPDTAGNVYLKFYTDDSAGVTLGTNSAVMDFFVPFGGGNNIPPSGLGTPMSSGISVAAAGGIGSTNHAAPATSLVVTVWYTD